MVAAAVEKRLRNPSAPLIDAVRFINYHLRENALARFYHYKARGLAPPPFASGKFQPRRRDSS
ncbi:MAG: hypothetical protein ACRD88_13665 [Terriglobia bacterium]